MDQRGRLLRAALGFLALEPRAPEHDALNRLQAGGASDSRTVTDDAPA
jgi:hypothetical protein